MKKAIQILILLFLSSCGEKSQIEDIISDEDQLESRIRDVESNLNSLKDEVEDLKSKIDTIETKLK